MDFCKGLGGRLYEPESQEQFDIMLGSVIKVMKFPSKAGKIQIQINILKGFFNIL